jgi:hypothetical protein
MPTIIAPGDQTADTAIVRKLIKRLINGAADILGGKRRMSACES